MLFYCETVIGHDFFTKILLLVGAIKNNMTDILCTDINIKVYFLCLNYKYYKKICEKWNNDNCVIRYVIVLLFLGTGIVFASTSTGK